MAGGRREVGGQVGGGRGWKPGGDTLRIRGHIISDTNGSVSGTARYAINILSKQVFLGVGGRQIQKPEIPRP